ncbi:hypothetical protein EDB81DRAFT_764885 [Dactylonectria macrodidyma]|uniref:Uncharacterized protein n=1 Tax=Dactylonectria macrodidyma TaxID=307937 RepID=A0A9P9DV18_9HYPO|nr:hypothetical protein EDB81DRAFT_764885 [Dactylonectria macrodidyma]
MFTAILTLYWLVCLLFTRPSTAQVLRCPAGQRAVTKSPAVPVVPNGCGDQSGGIKYPDLDFESDCWRHDRCWGNCDRDFTSCNSEFYDSMMATCSEKYGIPTQNLLCRAAAVVYFEAVSDFGIEKFYDATAKHCNCCSTDLAVCGGRCVDTDNDPSNCGGCGVTCPSGRCVNGSCLVFSCFQGGVCNSFPTCGPSPNCVCATRVEGGTACVLGTTPCSALSACFSTSGCPNGYTCVVNSCCGRAVCAPAGGCMGGSARTNMLKNVTIDGEGPWFGKMEME